MPQIPAVVLAQATGNGPTTVLGGKASGCFKNATPLGGPGKVIIKATKGSGIAAAQVYSKSTAPSLPAPNTRPVGVHSLLNRGRSEAR